MARPASSEGDQFSLFQQLLSAATRPSPIKVMFGRDELEVSDYVYKLSVSFLSFHIADITHIADKRSADVNILFGCLLL